jgi:hypothetical protein
MRISANEGPYFPGKEVVMHTDVSLNGEVVRKVLEASEEEGWLIQVREKDAALAEGEEDLGAIDPNNPDSFKSLKRVKMYGTVVLLYRPPAPDAD